MTHPTKSASPFTKFSKIFSCANISHGKVESGYVTVKVLLTCKDFFYLLRNLAIHEGQLKSLLDCVTKLLSVDASADQMEPLTILLEFLGGLLRHCKTSQPERKLHKDSQKTKQQKPETKKKDVSLVTPMEEDKPILQASQTLMQSQDIENEDDEDLNEIDEEAEIDVDNSPEADDNEKDSPDSVKDTPSFGNPQDDAEKDFASKLCTFTVSQNTFMEQHWYYCYTCNLTFSEGMNPSFSLL